MVFDHSDEGASSPRSSGGNQHEPSEYYFEYLGFPTLLYRNAAFAPEPPFGAQQIRPGEVFLEQQAQLTRTFARWYYPMDSIHVVTGQYSQRRLREFARKPIAKKRLRTGGVWDVKNQTEFPEDAWLDHADQDQEVKFVDAVRANMAGEYLDETHLHVIKRLDTNYAKKIESMDFQTQLDLSYLYNKERIDYADPAYLAPFPEEPTLKFARTPVARDHRIMIARIKDTDHFAPHLFGNCISVGDCRCGPCTASTCPTLYILHPVGVLMDRVRLSFLQFPRGMNVPTKAMDIPNDPPEEIQLKDRLLQLLSCGESHLMFIARTLVDVTLFSVIFTPPIDGDFPDCCWSSAKLTQLHRINHVSLSRHVLSFRPRHTTSNPAFASSLTPSRISTVYHCSNGNGNNIRTISIGPSACREQSYFIRNLKEISQVEYHSHPMLLWAVGTSYLRPALKPPETALQVQDPFLGLGSALYTVDLRESDKAVFQWSPSAETMQVEGLAALSGVAVDLHKEYKLWAASELAQMTWELDSRMPCRSVCSYTLPFYADFPSQIKEQYDYIGAGIIFCFPHGNRTGHLPTSLPVLGMSRRPCSNGVHCYHRNLQRPPLQKRPTEIVAGPVFPTNDISTVKSSRFCLPEISDAIFYCGLAAFETGISRFLDSDEIPLEIDNDDTVLCTVALTNKGDLYSQKMLRSTSTEKRGVECPKGFLAGSSIVELPGHNSDLQRSGWNMLPVAVSNDEPMISGAIRRSSKSAGAGRVHLKPEDLKAIPASKTTEAPEAFPVLQSYHESEQNILDGPEDLEFDVGTGSVRLAGKRKPEESCSVILPKCTWSSNNYMPFFDEARRAGIEAGNDEDLRSDITRTLLENVWSSDESGSEDEHF